MRLNVQRNYAGERARVESMKFCIIESVDKTFFDPMICKLSLTVKWSMPNGSFA